MARARRASTVGATLLLALLPCSLAGSALLLGYRLTGEPSPAPAYRTALIAADEKVVRLAASGPGLLVSRPDGLWSVGVMRATAGANRRDVVVARPAGAGEPAASPAAEFREGCRETTELTYLFVGPTHASLEALEDFECPAREYRYRDRLLAVVPFGKLGGATASTLERATISSTLGPAATAALIQAARGAGVRPPLADASSLDTFNWALVRRQGRWIARARHRHGGGRSAPVVDFTVPIVRLQSLIGHDQLVPAWPAIARAVPGALDAFSSPAGDLTVVLTRAELVAFRVRDGRLEPRPAARFPIAGPAAAVVVQWATGPKVEEWAQRVRAALPN